MSTQRVRRWHAATHAGDTVPPLLEARSCTVLHADHPSFLPSFASPPGARAARSLQSQLRTRFPQQAALARRTAASQGSHQGPRGGVRLCLSPLSALCLARLCLSLSLRSLARYPLCAGALGLVGAAADCCTANASAARLVLSTPLSRCVRRAAVLSRRCSRAPPPPPGAPVSHLQPIGWRGLAAVVALGGAAVWYFESERSRIEKSTSGGVLSLPRRRASPGQACSRPAMRSHPHQSVRSGPRSRPAAPRSAGPLS